MHIRVVDYNPRWRGMCMEEVGKIRKIPGTGLIGAFHIGSTAVLGLAARPVIDIMAVVECVAALDALAPQFEALGYEVMGEFGMPGRRYYQKGGDARTHQIQAFQFDNIQDIQRHLAFRDYLRDCEGPRVAYGHLKSGLAREFPEDIEGYSGGKAAFVADLERKALRWLWFKRS